MPNLQEAYQEAIKQFTRFVNIKLNMIKSTDIISLNAIEQVRSDISKFVQEHGKEVFNDVFITSVYDFQSTTLMHELSRVCDISILDYCIKDLNQLLILASKQNKVINEYHDSLYDLLGWFLVHKRVYPTLHFEPFTITKEEIDAFSKTMPKMRDYYNMKNINERVFMQGRGLLIEQKIKDILGVSHSVIEHNGYECDLIVDGYNVDVKSHTSNVYRLPMHRFVSSSWDYVLFVKVQQQDSDVFNCEYSEVMAKDLLYHMSINYSSMLLVNLQ